TWSSRADVSARGQAGGRKRGAAAGARHYCVFHSCVAAGPEGRVARSRSTARKDRAVAISVSALARSPGVARADVAPARSFGAITDRAATYRPLDAPLVVSPPPRSVHRGLTAATHSAAAPLLHYTIVTNAVARQ